VVPPAAVIAYAQRLPGGLVSRAPGLASDSQALIAHRSTTQPFTISPLLRPLCSPLSLLLFSQVYRNARRRVSRCWRGYAHTESGFLGRGTPVWKGMGVPKLLRDDRGFGFWKLYPVFSEPTADIDHRNGSLTMCRNAQIWRGNGPSCSICAGSGARYPPIALRAS